MDLNIEINFEKMKILSITKGNYGLKICFKTHVDCYLNPGYGAKSFCDIISKDNLIGLWDTYDLWDFFNTDSITQVLVVLKNCASNIFDTFTTNWINLFNIYINQTMYLIDNLSLFQILQVLQIPSLDHIFDNLIG
ncbi:unnamed protein product [Brachionus calyciflorus]|uniref:Uncharacterized protein n=1 Tax=Brachionus calyciflorus TaxID=104777 RepID=A0A813XHC4_9BILA|nr:unnamed protein product [Brachionus calyciflorus]